MLGGVTIAQGGVLPTIQAVLLPKEQDPEAPCSLVLTSEILSPDSTQVSVR